MYMNKKIESRLQLNVVDLRKKIIRVTVVVYHRSVIKAGKGKCKHLCHQNDYRYNNNSNNHNNRYNKKWKVSDDSDNDNNINYCDNDHDNTNDEKVRDDDEEKQQYYAYTHTPKRKKIKKSVFADEKRPRKSSLSSSHTADGNDGRWRSRRVSFSDTSDNGIGSDSDRSRSSSLVGLPGTDTFFNNMKIMVI